ncbi:uncharacterized protein BDV14DRAFT_207684 [Aspergillus stella-maris]|uniref:uncharacterized protein n=1 Tax=Aspergillus stella-maris TaxID=1810926 RepID=UPI003CCE5368
MVNFIQPKVDPLPTGIDLTGKTAVITGASAGMGLEVAKQLLRLRASTVILAVRNVSKGETCAQSLRRDRGIRMHNPQDVIKVMEVDMDRYDSVQRFAKNIRDSVPVVDLLILNAGIGLLKLERSPSDHDRTTQVNYYSNVLLIAELLPHLQAGAEKTGSPARISWMGSRAHEATTLEKKAPVKADEGVLEHMDKEEALAPRLDPSKVVINMMCPGMVNTAMSDVLPLHLRVIVNIVKAIRARPVEVGGWVILHSALVAGPESHGRFLIDKAIADKTAYIVSPAGQEVQGKLWEETIKEMNKLTSLPAEFQ